MQPAKITEQSFKIAIDPSRLESFLFCNIFTQFPVAVSQIRIVLSNELEYRIDASFEIAIE
jgi:hypothetical protein